MINSKRIVKQIALLKTLKMDLNTNEAKYNTAKERVAKLKEFYTKLFRGILAIAITAGINYYINAWENPWFLWVVFGVGLGLTLKAIKLFGIGFLFGRNWEERKINEFMNRRDL